MKNNRVIKIRTRFFVPGEGQSEQSFTKWLQDLADEQGLSVHLDSKSLGGGGYESMLNKALKARNHGLRRGNKYLYSFLLVDADRAERNDCSGDWKLNDLRSEAAKHNIDVCVQKPNFEGLMVNMLPGNKRPYSISASTSDVRHSLQKAWPDYVKPADARTLSQKFCLNDLGRVASQDPDLKNLLTKIGLFPTPFQASKKGFS